MTEHQFTFDGLPLYPVDMPDVRYKADLAAIVTQVCDVVGIEYDFYSSGCGSTMMMIADPSTRQLALEISDVIEAALRLLYDEMAEERIEQLSSARDTPPRG